MDLQECAMIARLGLGLNWNALLERHGTAVAALVLAAVFASGFFDALVLKKKDWACATWFLGIVSLAAVAYNRDPGLFHRKVKKIYLSAGSSTPGYLEWNVALDPNAFVRLLRSDLPIDIFPCATKD